LKEIKQSGKRKIKGRTMPKSFIAETLNFVNLRGNMMTLIFGARCANGVVIIGDKLVKTGESTTYIDKIRKCSSIEWAVFGAAGLGSLYEEFLTRLPDNVNHTIAEINFKNAKIDKDNKTLEEANVPKIPRFVYTVEDFKHDCVALLTDIMCRYSYAFEHDNNCILQILIGINTGTEAKLYYLDSVTCLPNEVKESYFIGQSHLVEIFQKCWSPSMTMAQSAKLGAFAIKYIETAELSKSVGVGKEGVPQVWAIFDGKQPTEVSGDTLTNFTNEVTKQAEEIYSKLNSIFR
jgi:hypothetical protein